jgi:hypothetical protein
MDLKTLKDTPPWEWPQDAGKMFLEILQDDQADESSRLLATELAGDFTVINDELAKALLCIVCKVGESEKLRARAAISLGPALESAYIYGFEDVDDVPISEKIFLEIQERLRDHYMDAGVPKEVRRRILEASVRAPQNWHLDAVRAAYSSDDEDWKLTAVFCMQFVRGFDEQILESLDSKNPDVHYEAVCAAGNWEVDAAWSHIAGLVTSEDTEKPLLLAAIEATANIRPKDASEILGGLIDSDDEEISEAAFEALTLAEGLEELDDDDGDEKPFH